MQHGSEVLLNIPRHSAYSANHRDKIWDMAAKSYLCSIVILICGDLFKITKEE